MEEELDIKDFVIALWKKKFIILAVTLVFFVLGIIFYGINQKEEKVLISSSDDKKTSAHSYVETDFLFARGTSVAEYIDEDGIKTTSKTSFKQSIDAGVIANLNMFATSKTFLNSVLEKVELEEQAIDLKSNIMIFKNGSSDLITLIVALEEEEKALSISEMILQELKDKVKDFYQIEEIVTVNEPIALEEKEIGALEEKIKDGETSVTNTVSTDSGSSKKKIILITALGFVLACGVVIVMELFDSSVKDEELLEKATNLKTLTKIPKTNLDVSDKFKLLRVNINECKTVLVTSPEKGDGKSFVAMNLAKSFARLGKKVLLIDLVQNSNGIANKYNGNGLTEYLDSNDKLVEKYIVETSVKNLSMLFAGNHLENQTELLESPKMVETLNILGTLYDVVIIDSSNVLESANSLAIAKIAKFSILVVSERKTKLANTIKAKNNIEDIGGNVIGNVLNNSTKK